MTLSECALWVHKRNGADLIIGFVVVLPPKKDFCTWTWKFIWFLYNKSLFSELLSIFLKKKAIWYVLFDVCSVNATMLMSLLVSQKVSSL